MVWVDYMTASMGRNVADDIAAVVVGVGEGRADIAAANYYHHLVLESGYDEQSYSDKMVDNQS